MSCWPWAFLLPLVARAQSGSDGEPSVDCISQISTQHPINLTCQLDFDDAEDEMTNITLCAMRYKRGRACQRGERKENTVMFQGLDLIKKYELRIDFNRSESFREEYLLKSIIKPTSPWIVNATFSDKSRTVTICIGTQYQGAQSEYLEDNLMFELEITSTQNPMPNKQVPYTTVTIEWTHLTYNTDYSVRVRARPNGDYFRGTWSDWSPSVSFRTPTQQDLDASLLICTLTAAAIVLLLILTTAILRWHKVIKSSIWPRIPNPKNTLLQMYKPNKALPISFNPEAFCDQINHLVEIPGGGRGSCEVRGRDWEGLTMWNPGDLEGVRLLPKASDGEMDRAGAPSTAPPDGSGGVQGGSWPKTTAAPTAARREEPYITMSSFFSTQREQGKGAAIINADAEFPVARPRSKSSGMGGLSNTRI